MTTKTSIREIPLKDWLLEGAALFGLDYDKWAFKCPACGHVATIGDFQQFKDQGATPDSAACECLGRYTLDHSRDGVK